MSEKNKKCPKESPNYMMQDPKGSDLIDAESKRILIMIKGEKYWASWATLNMMLIDPSTRASISKSR